jgi:manganese transport protein
LLTRVIAIIPAVIVILVNGENNIDSLLILSQVILSLQLGFAIIPLILFVSDKTTMGTFVIKPITKIAAWAIAAVLVYLNFRMVGEQATAYFIASDNIFWKVVIVLSGIIFIFLLVITLIYPLLNKRRRDTTIQLHPEAKDIGQLSAPKYKRIAVALEFSNKDEVLLSHAIGQADKNSSYILIHIVESASARILGNEADDFETRKDQEHIDIYTKRIKQLGFEAKGVLGFDGRARNIARLVKENNADLLVIGAHGHTGLKDWLYGETIDAVRHELKVPVLVVHV